MLQIQITWFATFSSSFSLSRKKSSNSNKKVSKNMTNLYITKNFCCYCCCYCCCYTSYISTCIIHSAFRNHKYDWCWSRTGFAISGSPNVLLLSSFTAFFFTWDVSSDFCFDKCVPVWPFTKSKWAKSLTLNLQTPPHIHTHVREKKKAACNL